MSSNKNNKQVAAAAAAAAKRYKGEKERKFTQSMKLIYIKTI